MKAIRFRVQQTLHGVSQAELGRVFGREGLASEIFAIDANRWSDPIASGLGWHLVYVNSREPRVCHSFDEVREVVRRDYPRSRTSQAQRAGLREAEARLCDRARVMHRRGAMLTFLRAAPAMLALMLTGSVSAHEIRPAYLEITENDQHRFDVLWKQPALGTLAVRLVPEVSNGLLDAPPTEEVGDEYFRGATLEQPAADTRLVRRRGAARVPASSARSRMCWSTVSFANGQTVQTVLKPDNPSLTFHLAGRRQAGRAYLFVSGHRTHSHGVRSL